VHGDSQLISGTGTVRRATNSKRDWHWFVP
jgi:hypothetical protein